MINDRIGNSILYSIKTYIQEIRWDKYYSGLRPLTITWTKEAIEELNMESRSFIYNFLDENVSKIFLENDILILVVDLKSERIRYYSDKNRKMYNFKISNFEKIYSNILYVINKMNEIQNYREINKKLETLLIEKKIKTLSFIEELNGDTKIEIEWNGNVEKSQKNEMMNMLNKVFLRLKLDMVIYDFETMRIRVWDKNYIRKIIILEENYSTLFKDFIKEFCL